METVNRLPRGRFPEVCAVTVAASIGTIRRMQKITTMTLKIQILPALIRTIYSRHELPRHVIKNFHTFQRSIHNAESGTIVAQ
jgi:hypothetical protein